MSVIVRTYAALNTHEADRAFYARAITQDPVDGPDGKPTGKWREGFSVGFYAATAQEAAEKASAWIDAERIRQTEILEGRAAAAEKRRKVA